MGCHELGWSPFGTKKPPESLRKGQEALSNCMPLEFLMDGEDVILFGSPSLVFDARVP